MPIDPRVPMVADAPKAPRRRKIRIPGDTLADAERREDENEDALPRASRHRASELPPAIQNAIADATRMSYAAAEQAAREGRLGERVLTERGWYIPHIAEQAA